MSIICKWSKISLKQGWGTLVQEGHCPVEFSSNSEKKKNLT